MQNTIKKPELGELIKQKRKSMGLTIEQAARKAGVGTKTWCRYEAGEPIRQDKFKNISRLLNLSKTQTEQDDDYTVENCRKDKFWSNFLEKEYGPVSALSFAVGSEILLDEIEEELEELAKMPKNSHIGQLKISCIKDLLPPQFLTFYDYDFLYATRVALKQLMNIAERNDKMIAHRVIDEILLTMIVEEACDVIDVNNDECTDWIYDMFGDSDIDFLFYDNIYLLKDSIYHFSHWFDEQFYCEEK